LAARKNKKLYNEERAAMEIWQLIWIIVLIAGIAGFAYISFKITIRGFAEVRSLLKEMNEGEKAD
jgi:hypothetical protein